MPISIVIPRLGWTMEEGIFLGWLKADGAEVRAGEALFRLESEKATEDIECLDGGILRIAPNGPKEGDRVPVGVIIGQLVDEANGNDDILPPVALVTAVEKAETSPQFAAPFVDTSGISHKSSPASPRARRVAAEMGIDWTKLKGSGRHGRVRERDVRSALAPHQSQTTEGVLPLSALRRRSAEHLVKSFQNTVPVTLTTTAIVSNLTALRRQFQTSTAPGDLAPSLTDFFVKLTGLALLRHPLLAARWSEDHLVIAREINIGLAVHTDSGLLVPVVRQVPDLPIRELASLSRYLIERAHQGILTTKEMEGGVFTITNLGMFGIDAFTPIINHPQCAILGIGRIRPVPAFVGDQVTAQDQVTLSLTFDHRIVDGVPAAQFMQSLTQAVENPGPWLMA